MHSYDTFFMTSNRNFFYARCQNIMIISINVFNYFRLKFFKKWMLPKFMQARLSTASIWFKIWKDFNCQWSWNYWNYYYFLINFSNECCILSFKKKLDIISWKMIKYAFQRWKMTWIRFINVKKEKRNLNTFTAPPNKTKINWKMNEWMTVFT